MGENQSVPLQALVHVAVYAKTMNANYRPEDSAHRQENGPAFNYDGTYSSQNETQPSGLITPGYGLPQAMPDFGRTIEGNPHTVVPPHGAQIYATGLSESTFWKERLTRIPVYPDPQSKEARSYLKGDLVCAFFIFVAFVSLFTSFFDSASVEETMGGILLALAIGLPAGWILFARIDARKAIRQWQENEQQRRRILANLTPQDAGIAVYLNPEPLPMVYKKHYVLVAIIAFFIAAVSAQFLPEA
ncbi:MAG: hypothetical protein Q3976_06930 [Corynebacterium sp.]|nr:hypothetical protein [Corynebacterium sp.]